MILEVLETLGNATTTEIIEYIGGNENSINRVLHSMAKFRMVVMLGQVITTDAPTKRWRLTA